MKILCVIDSLCPGGAQRQLVELAIGFKEKGHWVGFLIYHDIPFYKQNLEKAGIPITLIDESNYMRRLFRMRSFIRKGMFDSVLSFLEAPVFISEFSGLPYRKWKLVVGERNANPDILKSAKSSVYRIWHLFADYIISNSSKNIEYVLKVNPLLSQRKCKVIYNLVDFNYWQPPDKYVFKKSEKLKLVIIAKHQYQKNLNGLIDALLLMSKEELGKLSIQWYGDRLLEPFIDDSYPNGRIKINQNKLEGVISFFPARKDIKEIIQNADAIGLFSLYEGFPNVICEAMACGKPVVCSSVSDIPGFLSYDDKLLCNPGDPESIRHSLLHLINSDRSYLSEIAKCNLKIAKENFERENIVSDYLKVLT